MEIGYEPSTVRRSRLADHLTPRCHIVSLSISCELVICLIDFCLRSHHQWDLVRSTCSWAVEYGRLGLTNGMKRVVRDLSMILPHYQPPGQETSHTGLDPRRTRPSHLCLPPRLPREGRLLVALRLRVHYIISPYQTKSIPKTKELRQDKPMRNHPLKINNPLPRHIPRMKVFPGFLRGEMFQCDSHLACSFCCPQPTPVTLLIS